jgi:hypothetical protein
MREVWPLLVAVGAIVSLWAIMRFRSAKRRDERGVAMPRVEGFQVTSPLHPRMTRGCVFDLGLQYGRGFRRKEGPALPHGPDCQCRPLPFAFSGAEVFSGSLRRFAEVRCAQPDFPAEACAPLLEGLKRVNADAVPDTLTGYLGRIGLLDRLAPPHREPVRRFLEERYAFLRETQSPSDRAAAPADRPSDAV